MNFTLTNYLSSYTTPTANITEETAITSSYGLFTNTLEELMIDLVDSEPLLSGHFDLGREVYDEVVGLHAVFNVSPQPLMILMLWVLLRGGC